MDMRYEGARAIMGVKKNPKRRIATVTSSVITKKVSKESLDRQDINMKITKKVSKASVQKGNILLYICF